MKKRSRNDRKRWEGERELPDLNQILPWLDRIWDLRDMLPELKTS